MSAIRNRLWLGVAFAASLLIFATLVCILFLGGVGADQAGRHGLVVPGEVDLEDLPVGNWITVSIPISNQTDHDVTVFDIAPT